MSSRLHKYLLPEFDSIKDTDEEMLWVAKPKFVPFILSGLATSLFVIAFGVIWVLVNVNIKPENQTGSGWSFFWLFGLIPLVQGVWAFLHKILSFSNTAYGYSQKRVMMRTGFIGTDFKTIDYDKISDIEVTVNVLERAYNVGTIKFFSGRTETNDDVTRKIYDRWEAIDNPYEIFRRVKQISVDIKPIIGIQMLYARKVIQDTAPNMKDKNNALSFNILLSVNLSTWARGEKIAFFSRDFYHS